LAEAECGDKLDCLGRSDAANRRDFLHGASTQIRERTRTLQQLPSDLDGVCTRHAGAKQDCEQLRVG